MDACLDIHNTTQHTHLFPEGCKQCIMVSLLTFGYERNFNLPSMNTSGCLKLLSNYSGRTVQDFHLIPFYVLQTSKTPKYAINYP